jgi:threonine aldolase
MFGGGMRQVGILAAAGIYAIEHNLKGLADDHQNARRLAESLAKMPGLSIDLETVQTNIVLVDIDPKVMTVDVFIGKLSEKGVLCVAFGPARVRFTTHLDVCAADCEAAIAAVEQILAA